MIFGYISHIAAIDIHIFVCSKPYLEREDLIRHLKRLPLFQYKKRVNHFHFIPCRIGSVGSLCPPLAR